MLISTWHPQAWAARVRCQVCPGSPRSHQGLTPSLCGLTQAPRWSALNDRTCCSYLDPCTCKHAPWLSPLLTWGRGRHLGCQKVAPHRVGIPHKHLPLLGVLPEQGRVLAHRPQRVGHLHVTQPHPQLGTNVHLCAFTRGRSPACMPCLVAPAQFFGVKCKRPHWASVFARTGNVFIRRLHVTQPLTNPAKLALPACHACRQQIQSTRWAVPGRPWYSAACCTVVQC